MAAKIWLETTDETDSSKGSMMDTTFLFAFWFSSHLFVGYDARLHAFHSHTVTGNVYLEPTGRGPIISLSEYELIQ